MAFLSRRNTVEDEYELVGTIVGETPVTDDRSYAWPYQDASDQYQAAPINGEGNYELHVRFDDIGAESTIRVATPSYEIEDPLGEVTDGVVTAL